MFVVNHIIPFIPFLTMTLLICFVATIAWASKENGSDRLRYAGLILGYITKNHRFFADKKTAKIFLMNTSFLAKDFRTVVNGEAIFCNAALEGEKLTRHALIERLWKEFKNIKKPRKYLDLALTIALIKQFEDTKDLYESSTQRAIDVLKATLALMNQPKTRFKSVKLSLRPRLDQHDLAAMINDEEFAYKRAFDRVYQPMAKPDPVAARVASELDLAKVRGHDALCNLRRAYARKNHPDKFPPAERKAAEYRMSIANNLIDQALATA